VKQWPQAGHVRLPEAVSSTGGDGAGVALSSSSPGTATVQNGWTSNASNVSNGYHSRAGVGHSSGALSPTGAEPSVTQQKLFMSEFAREMEARFGNARHGFARLAVRREPYFSSPNLKHFLHKPQLKQYYRGGGTVLVRESRERKAHWNELFFDLVFIVVFQRIGHDLHSAASIDGLALMQFSVLFCASWKIWFDLTL